jgi:hypothetical protein
MKKVFVHFKIDLARILHQNFCRNSAVFDAVGLIFLWWKINGHFLVKKLDFVEQQ